MGLQRQKWAIFALDLQPNKKLSICLLALADFACIKLRRSFVLQKTWCKHFWATRKLSPSPKRWDASITTTAMLNKNYLLNKKYTYAKKLQFSADLFKRILKSVELKLQFLIQHFHENCSCYSHWPKKLVCTVCTPFVLSCLKKYLLTLVRGTLFS